MSSSNFLKNIAIVGASGTLGTPTLRHLLEANKSTVTAISREDSSATFPTNVRVVKGDYDSHEFLVSALKGQDALLLILSMISMDKQHAFISAAAEAGVKWIFPTEFGSDTEHEGLTAAVPLLRAKVEVRRAIEEAGLRWVGLVTNPWLDFSVKYGLFGIDVANRTANVYDGSAAFETTVMGTAALALARLLSLPLESAEGQVGLDRYANRLVFVSSGLLTQPEIFELIKQATGTQDSDWKITRLTADERIVQARELLAQGDLAGIPALMYGCLMKEELGGDYSKTRGLDNGALGLPEDDVLEVVKAAVA